MLKKLIFNIIIVIILVMVGMVIVKANKPKPTILKGSLNNIEEKIGSKPKEARYYRVIEE